MIPTALGCGSLLTVILKFIKWPVVFTFWKQKGGDESDEELDDEAMMALDKNISALFAEQQKRIQAKKDEKDRMRKEKILRRDFKIKVGNKYLVWSCNLLHAMSYLTLNSLDICLCHELLEAESGLFWLCIAPGIAKSRSVTGGFTCLLQTQDCAIRKWTVVSICWLEMIQFIRSFLTPTQR